MSRRQFLFDLLTSSAPLTAFHGGRVFQSTGMTQATTSKPFLVYHIGNDTSELLTDVHPAHRIFFQVYIHDEPGDYSRIDDIGDLVKSVLVGQGSPGDNIYTTRFLEKSQDLTDETFHTNFNYLRFQWALWG